MMTQSASTPFFFRTGLTAEGTVWNDEKGRARVTTIDPCTRCAGQGGWKGWPGFTCYRCGGENSMRFERRDHRVYTQEEIARLDETAAKRAATKAVKEEIVRKEAEAEAAAEADRLARMTEVEALYGDLLAEARPYADRNGFIADLIAKAERYSRLSPAQVDALNDALNREIQRDHAPVRGFLGEVSQRMVFTARVEKLLSFDTVFGLSWLHIMTTPKGETLVYRGSNKLAEERETITFRATVKEHKEFRGVNQTVVSRPKMEG